MNYADRLLSELAISIPMSTELFRKYRLDFCCGGNQTLKESCAKKNINLESIISEISNLDQKPDVEISDMPLDEMTEFIVERYHEDLRRRFPELIALSQKVERVHADHAACPQGLSSILQTFRDEMFLHMMKEENVLFPLINSGRGGMAMMPVKVMTAEHDAHGKQIEELHQLTNDFIPPQDACPTWKALYKGLDQLEAELMEHIHLENHILFPRALGQKV